MWASSRWTSVGLTALKLLNGWPLYVYVLSAGVVAADDDKFVAIESLIRFSFSTKN